jgi:hypothetical protein
MQHLITGSSTMISQHGNHRTNPDLEQASNEAPHPFCHQPVYQVARGFAGTLACRMLFNCLRHPHRWQSRFFGQRHQRQPKRCTLFIGCCRIILSQRAIRCSRGRAKPPMDRLACLRLRLTIQRMPCNPLCENLRRIRFSMHTRRKHHLRKGLCRRRRQPRYQSRYQSLCQGSSCIHLTHAPILSSSLKLL